MKGRDSIVIAGTGSGKTLCLLIPLLLRPHTITITISPLKRLQVTQVIEFQKYGIPTIAINEDTPNDPKLWQEIKSGRFRHLIVSPEQLGTYKGHLPRLARLIRRDRGFTSKIKRVHVDEAHNIYTAGRSHDGENAFRPAYGRLGEFRVLLPKVITFQALSATLPPHILSAVQHDLNIPLTCLKLQLSTNRPNIVYATTPLIGGAREFRNLDCLIPTKFHPPMVIPKTLVFHDCKQEASDAALYTTSRLPQHLRNRGIVKHYHSDMSPEYLQQTYEDFSLPDGNCRILHATAGASTGLDIQGVQIVIQYGICKNISETIQRAGRAARNETTTGLFVLMYEPWVLNISLGDDELNIDDPDKPNNNILKKNASKQDRTGCAAVQLVQSTTCLRELFATYLDDQSSTRLSYTTTWCCDRHEDDFTLKSFFLGDIYHGPGSDTRPLSSVQATTAKRKRNTYRPKEDRELLLQALITWRNEMHENDHLRSRPITWICDDDGLEILCKTHPDNLSSVQAVVALLDETEEWGKEVGSKIFELLRLFDRDHATVKCPKKSKVLVHPIHAPVSSSLVA